MKKQKSEEVVNHPTPTADGFGGEHEDGRREERLSGTDGKLPGEEDGDGFGAEVTDDAAYLFINLTSPDEVFDGVFLRHVQKNGPEGMKYDGFLFAEYPSGTLKVMRNHWSIGNKIAEMEREDPDFWVKHAVRIRYIREVEKGDNSVILYGYRFGPIAPGFQPQWNEQFPKK